MLLSRKPLICHRLMRAVWQPLCNGLWAAAFALLALGSVDDAAAQTVRPFGIRYQANINGDIAHIGNTNMFCSAGDGCAGALDGTGLNVSNNTVAAAGENLTINYVDVDGDAFGPTFNSSSSNLTMPAGAVVQFAGLYWGGRSASASRNQMLLKTPAAFGYTTVTALVVDGVAPGSDANNYNAVADVTALVVAGGNGTYFGANIQGTQADNNWAGWSLVVVYQSNTKALRNLVVFDGYAFVTNTATVILSLSGFLTPFSGPVVTQVGSIGYDGDRLNSGFAATGDILEVRSSTNPVFTTVSDANNPPNNFFNGTISDGGVLVTTRNPAYNFNFGLDIDRFTLPAGIVGNGATGADIRMSTGGERYYQSVITFATDLYVPVITPNLIKTATDINGGALVVGDILKWNISMNNTGLDTGINLIMRDGIPANTTYVSGSAFVTAGANNSLVAKTDALADDVVDYQVSAAACNPATAPCVVFRLGTGANATNGGSLAFGESTALSFNVTINNVTSGTQISNTAYIAYNGQTLSSNSFAASSAAVAATVTGPPTISKSFTPAFIGTGGTSELKVTVANPAGNGSTLTNVAFSDTYPSNLTNSAAPLPNIVCTAGASPGTLSGGVALGNTIGMSPGATIPPGGSCDVTVNVTSAVSANYLNTTSIVTSNEVATGGASASATLAVGKMAITKTFVPSTIQAGQAASLSVTIVNPLGTAVTGAGFVDAFPAGLIIATPVGMTPTPCGAGSGLADSAGTPLTAGDVGISMPVGVASGGSMIANGSCTFSVNVTGATAATFGLFDNTTTGVTRSGDAVPGNPSNTARLTIVGRPNVTKTMTPGTINTGDTTQVSITVSNPNTTTTITRAGTAFIDTYPLAFANTNPANVTINCSGGSSAGVFGGGPGGANIGMSNMSLAPGGSCTVTSLVTGTSGAVPTSGVNTTGVVTFDNAPAGGPATAGYTITNLVEPTVTKSYASNAVSAGSAVVMTIVLTNPGGNASAINGAAFTDTFPVGMVNTSGSATIAGAGCGGTATVSSGALSVSGLTIPTAAPRTCTITTQVSAPSPGSFVNSTGVITTTNTPAQITPALATLSAYRGLQIDKAFGSPSIVPGSGTTTLTLTITNPSGNPGIITAGSIIDTFPPGMQVATGGAATASVATGCFGIAQPATLDNNAGVTIANGASAIRLQNIGVAVGTPCVVTISAVRVATSGNFTNIIATNDASQGAQGTFPAVIPGTSTGATLSAGKVGIAKAFSPATINISGTSTLTFTLTNTSALAVSGIAFTDVLTNSLPTTRQLTLASGTVGGTCTGVASNATTGGTSFVVTAGDVPASSSCTITIQVTSALSGLNPNQTTGVTHAADPVAGAVSNTAVLTVIPPPVVTKSFLPAQVGTGARSTLSVTVTNTNNFPVTLSALTDAFPAGLVVGSPILTSNGCGGTLRNAGDTANLAAGDTGFLFKNGNVATNSSCVVAISVTASVAGSYVNTIAAGALSSDAGSNLNPASATLTVLSPLTVVKTFTPNSIAAGGVSVLQVRLTNPNTVAVTGAGFTDTYPANLNNTASPAGATSCPGGSVTAAANGASLSLSGATVPASNFCDITVNVTSGVSGVRTNPAFGVATVNAGTATSGAATLSVGVPAMTKTFSPNPVSIGGVSTISFVINNPTAAPMNNIGFTDTFPAGMTLAYAPATPQCGGTLFLADGTTTPPTAGGGSVRLGSSTGTLAGSIATSGSCTIAVAVTTSSSGVRVNLTGVVTASASVGNTATDTLTTLAPPVASKSFAPATVGVNQTSVLTVRIDNPNAFAINGAAFTDNYPATVVNAASPSGATTCGGGTVSAVAGVGSVSVSGASVPASSFCLVTVNVIASTSGSVVNTLPSGSVTSTNAGSSTAAATAGLLVLAAPVVQKDFIGPSYVVPFGLSGTTMPLNTPTVMRIRLTNVTSSAAITGVALSDTYPAGLVNSTPANAAIAGAGCTGSLTATSGGSSLGLSGMTIPASTTCTITVNVQSALSNFYTNSTGPVSTGNAGTGVTTSGSIYVMAPVVVTKAFTPNFVSNGATVTAVGLTVINPNPYPVTNAAIVDAYAGSILNATSSGPVSAPPLFSGVGCTGTVATGGSSVNLTTGTVPANSSCSISINARVSAVGDQINCTGGITTANAGPGTDVCATVNRGATATSVPPTISKSFTPAGIAVNGVSTLSFTVTNPNTAGVGIITSTAFVDALPAGLAVATPAVTTNSCGGTWNATAGSTVINLTGSTIATNSSCVVSVQVTGNTPGIYTNISGVVTASTGVGNQATAVLTILDPPALTKSFTPAAISQGGVSTISFVISNSNSSAFTNLAFTDTLTNMTILNPPAATVTGAGCTGFTVTAPNGGSLITVGGSNTVPARVGVTPSTCTITVQVTSVVAGVWPNATSQTTSNAGTGAGSNSATLTVNQITVGVSGYVFGDLNANGVRNPLTEDWTSGVLVYVNIVTGGAVVQSQAVNVGTGFFNFPAVPYGNYTIIVSDNPANITPVIPAGFSATVPTTASWNLPINGGVPPVVDFGFTLPALSRVSGRVFRDSGLGGGTANNGILDAGEGGSSPGIAGVPVAVTNCAGTTFATVTTDGNGFYLLNFPSTATNVCIIETNPGNNAGSASSGAPNPGGIAYLSTGASSAGAAITASTCAAPPGGGGVEYDRANDRICFLKSGGSYVNYSNLNFGDVPFNTFVPDGAQQTTPGSVLFYPHVFTFETSGTVTFGTTVVATNPANYPGWSEILYRDADCDGKIEAADTVLTTATVVPITSANPPANKICVVLRENVPPAAPFGSQRVVRVDANFIYTNASPGLSATYTRNDTTTVEDKSSATIKLVKEVCNETTAVCTDSLIDQSSLAGNGNYATNNTAKAGDVLRYRIIYTNLGGTVAGGGVSNLVIRDATPPFTTLVGGSLACIVTPPAPATCTPLTAPPLGVQWTIGSVSGGGQGIVLYKVSVQ